MPVDLEKELKNQIKKMEEDEIPSIDIEMAIQRKYPRMEQEMLSHDGKPESKKAQQKLRRQCMDTQGNYGTPCRSPAQRNCYGHLLKGKNFPICSNHSYITGDDSLHSQGQYFCHECSIEHTFGDGSMKQQLQSPKMDSRELTYLKTGRKLTVLQAAKLSKIARQAKLVNQYKP
jgi:hypothetical protein